MKVVFSILTAIVGLAVMCLFSIIMTPEFSGFVNFLVFILFAGIIASINLYGSANKSKKIIAFSAFVGLLGVALMVSSGLVLDHRISGFVSFAIFVVMAIIISIIFACNKDTLLFEQNEARLYARKKGAERYAKLLKEKGFKNEEIKNRLMSRFFISEEEAKEICK